MSNTLLKNLQSLLLLFWVLSLGCTARQSPSTNSSGQNLLPHMGRMGAVATVHPLATQAGIDALKRGGNAVDAAVAAALMLGVVDSHNSGIGGGCFIVMRLENGQPFAIDGREMAGAKAHRDMYLRDGKAVPALSRTGPLAVGVPGSLAAYDLALRKGGKHKLSAWLNSAVQRAERGFPIDANYAKRLAATAEDLAKFKASAKIFLRPDGKPWPKGHLLKQPELAATYRNIAEHGIGWFYGGPFAEKLHQWMKANGGILTQKDFAGYQAKLRKPVVSTYRRHTIYGFPPPSSGGVHVIQILNMLEQFDLASIDRADPAKRRHIIAEAMKLAFADRAHWLGDPDFAKVPRGLISKAYARSLAKRIDPNKASEVAGHSTPPRAATDLFEKHTTHIAAADSHGNLVAITTTLNTAFGSKVTIPGTGVLMNNQMDDFSAQPGVPNIYGLIGTEANSIAPGKRPLSSMSPTLVYKDGSPVMTLGAAGGPTIISQVVQVIVNHFDLGMPPAEAVAAARFHHQWRPDFLFVEPSLDAQSQSRLNAMGHTIKKRSLGVCQAILRTKDGMFIAVSDPRVQGSALGYDK